MSAANETVQLEKNKDVSDMDHQIQSQNWNPNGTPQEGQVALVVVFSV